MIHRGLPREQVDRTEGGKKMSFLLFVLVVFVIIKSQDIPDQVKRGKYQVIADRWTCRWRALSFRH